MGVREHGGNTGKLEFLETLVKRHLFSLCEQ